MKRKNRWKKIHNAILWTITVLMAILCLLSILCIDSDSWVPVITLFASMSWLLPFVFVNEDVLERISEDDVDR